MSTSSKRRLGRAVTSAVVGSAVLGAIGVTRAVTDDRSSVPGPPSVAAQTLTGEPGQYASSRDDRPGQALAADDATSRVTAALRSNGQLERIDAAAGSLGFDVTVRLASNHDGVPEVWIASLAVGAFAELVHSEQTSVDQVVAIAKAVGPDAGGRPRSSDLGSGGVRLGQRFGSPADAALEAHLREVAQKFELGVADIQVLHPLESAVTISLTVPAGEVSWTIDELRAALFGASPNVEGALVELKDPEGKPLLIAGTAYRTGLGGLWFAPGQDQRFGALHGGLASR